MLVFKKPRSSFSLSYNIPCENCFLEATSGFNGGRNFLFGGMSSLCPWPSPAPTISEPPSRGPPSPTEYWDVCSGNADFDLDIEGAPLLANNLGGLGPNFDDPEELRYGQVARGIDLVVTADAATYAVADDYELYQGKWEMFGQINVHDDSTATLSFEFQDSNGGEAVELEEFYLTVFDLDEQKNDDRHEEELCVDAGQFDAYVLDDNSEVLVEEQKTACDGGDGASTVFRSSEAGFLCDNPTSPSDLGTVSCADCDQCADQDLEAYFPIDRAKRAVAGPRRLFLNSPPSLISSALAR